jgi:MerR family transcriptional regulator, light-induced transcriptional regulator
VNRVVLQLHRFVQNAPLVAEIAQTHSILNIAQMSFIRTNAAAAMLGVSPNTLRSWERRFAYPMPQRTEGGHRQFELREIEVLRQAFAETQNISSAVSLARERGEGPSSPARLRTALASFAEQKADRLLEESLAVRSVERTVESVLLASVQSLEQGSPEYHFACRYASGWLASAQRVAPAATREEGILIFDASSSIDIDSLHVQALELFLRRAGLRVLTLPVGIEATRLGSALRALRPSATVLAGPCELEMIGRLVYAARLGGDGVSVFDYRGALPETGASTVSCLGPGPIAASEQLREHLSAGSRVAREHRVLASAI